MATAQANLAADCAQLATHSQFIEITIIQAVPECIGSDGYGESGFSIGENIVEIGDFCRRVY